jgi:serine/threonine protein kinase
LYAAPEMFSNNHGLPVDVYSFGVVLLEIYLNELPELDPNKRNAQVERVKTQNARFGSLLQSCLSFNPEDRPHPKEIQDILNQIGIF